ncbi:glycoside hydrolase family 78 protein [Dermatobacter hominis]|uniref:glycoside hydrolase family 78 protein n=1 Tax=Dermatobacter hominis TaxID=2884263 RepID=UPI001D1021B5|nr:glycoside hydrolase family 78 protein [Dermatobacter hominis]UDY34903.1 glycoside hydrolase family 78 protein [Dermatobacter hominis]
MTDATYEVRVLDVRIEHRDPFGIGTSRPRLTWRTDTYIDGWRQAAADIEIDGAVSSRIGPGCVLVDWPGAPLRSRQRATVRVRVTGTDGSHSGWSAPLEVEAALLTPADWRAEWVSPAVSMEQTALLRCDFDTPIAGDGARLHISSLGVFEAELNGSVVGDHVLDPGWTSYRSRVVAETFDVTDLLRRGRNTLGIRLADGWFRGRLGADAAAHPAHYGDRIAAIAQLDVVTDDGGASTVCRTDARWRWIHGATTRASIYDGEDHDARAEPAGWSRPEFDDTGWFDVDVIEHDVVLVPRLGPPVRRTEEVEVAEVLDSGPSDGSRLLVDFGQNLVGRLRLDVDGPRGTTIELRHVEVLESGVPNAASLRSAEATDRYTLRGGGPERWEPRFTFHGFRYATVDGWPGRFDPGDLRAEVCHSDMTRTGWFSCDDPLLERFHENVVWGMRGNFLSVPTDCPQRDERLGWTGDIAVFVPTACFLFDCAGMLRSWLTDLALEQRDDIGVPWVVPNVLDQWIGCSVWGDAAVTVPWTIYDRFGDAGVLEDQYDSMSRWADLIVGWAGGDDGDLHLEWVFQFGDWLDPTAPGDDPSAGATDKHLVGNAALCRTLDLMRRIAALLGRDGDAERYAQLHERARSSFVRSYLTADGLLTSDAQTAYAIAIAWDLLPDDLRTVAGTRLAELVRSAGHRIGTGFVGTPLVCDALCDTGHVADAYSLILQTEAPSWLGTVGRGATTVWERWDAIRADGSLHPAAMTSFNHYAFGAVADWLHRSVAGLAPDQPGYRRLRVRPLPGPGLDRAAAQHDTPYGRAEVGWERNGGHIRVSAVVPPNTTARVELPGSTTSFDVGAGRHHWDVQDPSRAVEAQR